MSIEVESTLAGFKELSKKLQALGSEMGGKVLRQAVGTAITPALKEIRASAPVGNKPHKTRKGRLVSPGFLSRNIKKKTFKSRSGSFASATIGAKAEAFYGSDLLEKGTKNIDPAPWMEPAFHRRQTEVTNKLKVDLLKKIKKATK